VTSAPGCAEGGELDQGRRSSQAGTVAVGLDPAFVGDADASGTVDGLVPLWFALVQRNGGNRKLVSCQATFALPCNGT